MMTDPATAAQPAPLHLRILCLPEAMMGTVFDVVDVLRLASTILTLRDPGRACALSWRLVRPDGGPAWCDDQAGGVSASNRTVAVRPERSVLVLPALFVANAHDLDALASRRPDVLALLRHHVAQGGVVAACANGLIFPALTGMLDGLRLDVHWAFKPYFARTVPACDFTSSDTMSFHDRLYSCIAPAQQREFAIAILRRLFDADVAEGCAQLLQVQPQRQQLANPPAAQAFLSVTSDSPVYRAKQWLEANVEAPYDLTGLAAVASSSERTLLRHFNSVFGMSPLTYLQDLRVQRARLMLEISLNDIQTIALACGYANASTFSRLFQRATGMRPGAYRAAYRLRSKRTHWRVESNSGSMRGEAAV
jgi:transcriptional regulator GlxA family with amidase domain